MKTFAVCLYPSLRALDAGIDSEEMMMSRGISRLWSGMLTMAIMAGLAACGGTPATSPPTQPAAPTADGGPTATAASPGEKRIFKVWHYEAADSAMGQSWDDALKDFQAAHPEVEVQFELKTFDQIQQTAQQILNSPEAPDVMEVNKGNATAGLYARQGLLSDLTGVATERGWDKLLSPSIQATCRYDDRGIMGSGQLYGVTTYGEFVMVYYNKNLFEEHGVSLPTGLEEFEAAADKFLAAGITPTAVGGLDKWPVTQNFYELALYKADREFITNYMTFKSEVDFHGPEFTYAADKLAEHFEKGYYGENATGTDYDDSNSAFVQGQLPMYLTGSWMFGTFLSSISDFEWGLFVMPGKEFNTGSGGNLWVVPAGAKNKDLAYEFIDLTLQPKAQTIMANAGGIPLSADLAQIEDEHVRQLNAAFSALVQNDGLAFYPDWPAPGYMDTLGGGLQELISGTQSTSEFLDSIAGPWAEYKSSLP